MEPTPLVDTIVQTPEYMSAAIAAVGAIIGAVLATIVTLLSVSMTNRHNRDQQKQQLEAESRERQRERHASLRSNVYLPAADAFTGLIAGMSRLLNLEIPDDDIADRAQAFGATLTQIQMIASPETIKRVAELQREIVRTIAALQQKRHPMKMRGLQINVAAGVLQAFNTQRETLTKAAARLTSGARVSDNDVSRYVDARFEYQSMIDRGEQARIDWLRLMLAQETERAEMFREFVRRMEALVTLQSPLLAAIRGELETEEALSLITEEAEKTNAVGVRAVSDMIPVIEGTIEDTRRELAQYEKRKLTEPVQEQGVQERAGH